MSRSLKLGAINPEQRRRINKLQDTINDLSNGSSILKLSPNIPADIMESHLEDIVNFESVGSGTSLFEGLQQHGMKLPRPEELNEFLSSRKAMEIFRALDKLGVFLIGFEGMTARELYSILWNQTLWEGCYVKRLNPGSITLIDVSHKMKQSEIHQFLDDMMKPESIH
jgi:hypothetical protein